jgi:FAD/FMN-containing dehydrogenase
MFSAEANWTDAAEDEAQIAWARDMLSSMRRFSSGGVYLNFPGFGEEKEEMARAAYGANYPRLQALKARYDPTNLFRMNINIRPAT